ncbi:MAG: dienelactone hydrolase family protein [Kofleriaceae bacterium]
MKIERLEIAGLTTRIVGPAPGHDDAKLTVILLHGFGAPGDDLVDLARYLEVPARFVFPEAPLPLGGMYGDARAWWLLDLARLEAELHSGDPHDRSAELPEGLAEARAQVSRFVDQIAARFATTTEHIVLGGFSQGAMVALDVALHRTDRLAGVVLMSGTLIAESEWSPRMAQLAGTPVFQSHGRTDALLPFAVAETLRDKLRGAGALVEWQPFAGGHELPPGVLAELATFLRARTAAG